MVGYLWVHRGQRFASTTVVAPMTEAFVCNIGQFVAAEGIDLIAFEKGQRKDEVTQKYLREFRKSEGVLYVGKAQEKARVTRNGAPPLLAYWRDLSVDRAIDGHGQPLLFLWCRPGLRAVLPEVLLLLSL